MGLLRLFWWRRGKLIVASESPDPPFPADEKPENVPPPNLTTPSGLRVVASVGGGQRKLPQSEDECRVVQCAGDRRDYACGHAGAERFAVSIYGERTKEVEQEERCPECFVAWMRGFCIRCALCGLPIFPGEGVALYAPRGEGLRLDIATRVEDSVIGCLRWDCCPSGGFFAGYWTENGFKPAFGGETGAEKAFSTNSTVIGNV